jgi:hypothetical protein
VSLTVHCAFNVRVTDDISYETSFYFNAAQVGVLLEKQFIEQRMLIADSETITVILSKRKASKYVNIEAIKMTE